jgi:hypothetical protein
MDGDGSPRVRVSGVIVLALEGGDCVVQRVISDVWSVIKLRALHHPSNRTSRLLIKKKCRSTCYTSKLPLNSSTNKQKLPLLTTKILIFLNGW